jgi:hypothetical protein
MSKRYEITGRTNSPLDPFPDFGVGAVVEGDLDEQVEHQLVSAGALRVVPDEPAAAPEAKAAEPEAPQPKPSARSARRTGRHHGTDQPAS